MPISFETYERVALEDDEQWELVCGRLRKKPGMTIEHWDASDRLDGQLRRQIDPEAFAFRMNASRLRIPSGAYYVPDVVVIPREITRRLRAERPGRLELIEEPVPFVAEVWSPSTGDYDVEVKLLGYQERGDLEIWRIHPYERTVTTWRRQADGSYAMTIHTEGYIELAALAGVRIDVAALFVE